MAEITGCASLWHSVGKTPGGAEIVQACGPSRLISPWLYFSPAPAAPLRANLNGEDANRNQAHLKLARSQNPQANACNFTTL